MRRCCYILLRGTSIEAEPRHLGYNKTKAHKKRRRRVPSSLHSTNANKTKSRFKILLAGSPLIQRNQ